MRTRLVAIALLLGPSSVYRAAEADTREHEVVLPLTVVNADDGPCLQADKALANVLSDYRLTLRQRGADPRDGYQWEAPKLSRGKDSPERQAARSQLDKDLKECATKRKEVQEEPDLLSGSVLDKLQPFLNSAVVTTKFDRATTTATLSVDPRGASETQNPALSGSQGAAAGTEAKSEPDKKPVALERSPGALEPIVQRVGQLVLGVLIGTLPLLLVFVLAALSLHSLRRALTSSAEKRLKGLERELATRERMLTFEQSQQRALERIVELLERRFRRRSPDHAPAQAEDTDSPPRKGPSESEGARSRSGSKTPGWLERAPAPPPPIMHPRPRFQLQELIVHYNSAVRADTLGHFMDEIGPCLWVQATEDRLEVVSQAPTGRSVLDLIYCEAIDGSGILLPGPTFVAQRTAFGGMEGLSRALKPYYQSQTGADFVIKSPAQAELSGDRSAMRFIKAGVIELTRM